MEGRSESLDKGILAKHGPCLLCEGGSIIRLITLNAPSMHLAAPRPTMSENRVSHDDHTSRNKFESGMVLQELLAMYTGDLGHASRIATTSYLTELPWPGLPDAVQCDESKRDRVAIPYIQS